VWRGVRGGAGRGGKKGEVGGAARPPKILLIIQPDFPKERSVSWAHLEQLPNDPANSRSVLTDNGARERFFFQHMYICICIYMCSCVFTYLCVRVCICICIYMCSCVFTYFLCARMYMYMHIYAIAKSHFHNVVFVDDFLVRQYSPKM